MTQYPYGSNQYVGYGGYPQQPAMPPQPHSGVGIASFITALIGGLVTVASIVMAGVLEVTTPGGMDQESPQAIATGCFIITGIGVCLIAAILGLVSLFQRDRRRLFGVLGLVFGGTAVVMTLLLMIIGLTMA